MLLLLCRLATAGETPRTFTLDAARSHLYVRVLKDASTLSSDLGHHHVIAAMIGGATGLACLDIAPWSLLPLW